MKHRTSERGDTLIEVLVAISVLGVVIVGAFSLMNKGVAQVYDAMERSEVRLLLDRQVESLTYARDEYFQSLSPHSTANAAAVALWNAVRSQPSVGGGAPPALNNCTSLTHAFVVTRDGSGDVSLGTVSTATATSFPSPGNGIWIQKIDSTPSQIPYKDFYIRACWIQNSNSQTQVLSTVVRLYDHN